MKASRQIKLAMSSCVLHLILQLQYLVDGVVLLEVALADMSCAVADGEDSGGALPWKDMRQMDLSLHRK